MGSRPVRPEREEPIRVHVLGLLSRPDDVSPERTSAFLRHLESFVEELLDEAYGDLWDDTLDGFSSAVVRVSGRAVEVIGMAYLIADQTLVPLYVRFGLSGDGSEIASLDCRIGELDPASDRMIRHPHGSRTAWQQEHLLVDQVESVRWAHRVTRPIGSATGQRLTDR